MQKPRSSVPSHCAMRCRERVDCGNRYGNDCRNYLRNDKRHDKRHNKRLLHPTVRRHLCERRFFSIDVRLARQRTPTPSPAGPCAESSLCTLRNAVPKEIRSLLQIRRR